MTAAVDVLWTGDTAPGYAHPGDAGADLVSAESVVLEPGERRLVGTGLRIALPDGYAAFVLPRSGLAAKHGITIVNAPGTIDAGYRGEIKVALLNTDRSESYTIAAGDRIAQMIVMPVPVVRFVPVAELPDSVRGVGGFGSSGYGAAGAAVSIAATPITDADGAEAPAGTLADDDVIAAGGPGTPRHAAGPHTNAENGTTADAGAVADREGNES